MLNRRPYLSLCVLLLLVCACGELERDNPLDPRNPHSERRQVALVEAFVNEATPFSSFALQALDSLASNFAPDQVIFVEHHLPSTSFADAYALQESADRYHRLVSIDRGIPDVFFNGSPTRVQGASSSHSAALRFRSALQSELGKFSFFTIEAQKSLSAAAIEIEVAIARLGDSNFSQFAVFAVVWEDLGSSRRHHVVRKVFAPEIFSSINAGEIQKAHFAGSITGAQNVARLQAAVILEHSDNRGREVLQASLAE